MSSSSLFSPSFLLTAAFACALALQLLAQVGLLTRQVRHVARHRSAVPAAFAEKITLAAHQKAADYTLAKAQVGLLQLAWGAMLLLGWTLLGGLDALHQALLAAMGPGLGQQIALVAAFALISGVLELPFSLYQTFVVEQRFGFNQSTLGLWLADVCKSSVLAAVIGLPLVAAVLWLMQAAGSLWWLWAWGLWTGFQLLLMWIFPTFIAPLFNKFQPLEDAALKERVTTLMQRCGFAAKGLFVMDGSRRSAHANAYFTGLGNAKRVVFYDTLLKNSTSMRSKRCWRTSWATSNTATSPNACWACLPSAWAGWRCWAGSASSRGFIPAWAWPPHWPWPWGRAAAC